MPGVINAYGTPRPAGKNLALAGQALIQQLDGIGACGAPDLIAHANPAALVSAPDGISIDVIFKHGARTGQPVSIARYDKAAIVQAFADSGKGDWHVKALPWSTGSVLWVVNLPHMALTGHAKPAQLRAFPRQDVPHATHRDSRQCRQRKIRPRPDIPAGCIEKLDREFLTFLKYVWTFDRSYRPSIEAVRLAAGPLVPVVHLRGGQQIAEFLDGLPAVSEGCLE